MSQIDYSDGYKAYVYYIALKRHFTSSYDFFKYNGKVKSSLETFKTKSDAYFFVKTARKQDYKNIILANIVKNPNVWVGEISDDSGMETYTEWKRRNESLGYIFELELQQFDDDIRRNFVSNDGETPKVIHLHLARKISPETFSIVCHLTNAYAFWEEKSVDFFLYNDIIRHSKKYYPFLSFDKKKFTQIIKKRFFEC
jgi:hypothetical protein